MYLPGQVIVYHLRRYNDVLWMLAMYNGVHPHDHARHRITIIKHGVAHQMKQVRSEQLCTLAEYMQKRRNGSIMITSGLTTR